MTVTTNTLGSNSAEIIVTGPESYLNVAASVTSFLTSHGWNLMPDSFPTFTCTATSSSGTPAYQITISATTNLVVGQPVQFTGTTFGGIATSTTYFILQIVDSTHITVATTSPIQNSGATAFALTTASGSMTMVPVYSAVAFNSTNTKGRIFWANCLTGQVWKFIRLNLADLTIDTGRGIGAAGATADEYPTLSTTSTRFSHFQNFSYPRDLYINNAVSPTNPAVTPNATVSLGFAGGWAIGHSSINTSGAIITSTAPTSQGPAANAKFPFYAGQNIIFFSPSTGNWAYTTVSSFVDSTGVLTYNPIIHSTYDGTSLSDWVPLYPNTLNYNNSLNPAYIYISATARHVCIQTRNCDGIWNDWTSVSEYENPLLIGSGGTQTQTSWGLTTGYTSANTGVVVNANNSLGFEQSGVALNATGLSGLLNNSAGTYTFGGTHAGVYNPTIYGPPPVASSQWNRLIQFTGPFSTPYTYKGRTGTFASQTTKLITPLGEAGLLGTQLGRQSWQGMYGSAASNGYTKIDTFNTTHFRGMGDVMPNVMNLAASGITYSFSYPTTTQVGTKHFALTPSIILDIGNESNTTIGTILSGYLFDGLYGPGTTTGWSTNPSNTGLGTIGSYRAQSQYSTTQPTPMGRIYGIKYVTTGLGTLNTINIKVDANGFASNSGTGTDHLVFCFPSYYVSPDVSTNIGYTINKANSTTVVSTGWYQETAATQNTIRNSQSVAVAFPK